MMRSLNELESVLRKAASGAGLPIGLAEDIGAAGAWLTARGQDGTGAVLLSIRAGISEPMTPVTDHGTLVFAPTRVAICGPSVIDMLAAFESIEKARLRDVDSPMLLLGLAGSMAGSYDIAFDVDFAHGGQAQVTAGGLVLTGPLPVPGTELVIARNKIKPSVLPPDKQSNGVEVAAELWRGAEVLAARTYVPSSEASRAAGAGAGLSDND